MSCIAFVWNPGVDMYGHASLWLKDGPYISWWPSRVVEGAGDKLGGMFGSKAIMHSMREDKAAERHIPSWASAPITQLDEDAIKKWWVKLSGWSGSPSDKKKPRFANGRYNVVNTSCSGVVYDALVVGGLFKTPRAAAVASQLGVVIAPSDIQDVATALTGELGFWDTAKFFVPTDLRNAVKYGRTFLTHI